VSSPNDGDAAYRAAVGIMLLNRAGLVFVARRIDMAAEAWQMPQGGIDDGETPRGAALRELKEEIGTDKAVVLGESRDWLRYDLPAELAGQAWGGRYRGQRQKWFAMRFTGSDGDIDLATEHPEFSEWKWVAPTSLPRFIIPFKRQLYVDVLAEFAALLTPPAG
jgi:putative (di)nucleoside polyphosphate hydrolase